MSKSVISTARRGLPRRPEVEAARGDVGRVVALREILDVGGHRSSPETGPEHQYAIRLTPRGEAHVSDGQIAARYAEARRQHLRGSARRGPPHAQHLHAVR